MTRQKSALLYLCGHPGTGKTSTLNYILSGFKSGNIGANLLYKLSVHMYNAMSFRDVKSFCFQLLEDLSLHLTGKPFASDKSKELKKKDIDDDEVSNMVARMLSHQPDSTKIIVIDEIDAFEAQENAFRTMTKAILASKTNCIVIGIANSVDLPFKKKHSAIAMRDAQLLFEPYSEEQIITIIEEKVNKRFTSFPMKLKVSPYRDIFFELLDDKGMDMIAKKVSKMNGDVRVAFDLIKSSFVELFNRVKYVNGDKIHERKDDSELPPDDKLKISFDIVRQVMQEKYSSKLPQTLINLPR
jgi:Cdc6-like AAA superfamily ATPase